MSRGHCGKQAYKSRGQAERALQTIRRYGSKDNLGYKPTRVYLCDGDDGNESPCWHFHLTSKAG